MDEDGVRNAACRCQFIGLQARPGFRQGRRWAKEPGSGGMVSTIQLPFEAGETVSRPAGRG